MKMIIENGYIKTGEYVVLTDDGGGVLGIFEDEQTAKNYLFSKWRLFDNDPEEEKNYEHVWNNFCYKNTGFFIKKQ